MTKKHFEAIAKLINRHIEYVEEHPPVSLGFDDGFHSGYRYGVVSIIEDLADYFEESNPRFDREQFLTACGL